MGKLFMDTAEVAEEMGVSRSYAYKLVRQMNKELQAKGLRVIPGRVSRAYFEQCFFGETGVTDSEKASVEPGATPEGAKSRVDDLAEAMRRQSGVGGNAGL